MGTAVGSLRGHSPLLYALHMGIGYGVFGAAFSCEFLTGVNVCCWAEWVICSYCLYRASGGVIGSRDVIDNRS